jgi:hypothetical protein
VRLLVPLTIFLLASSAGADKKPPHGATRISIDYTHSSFQRDEAHYVIEWGKRGGYIAGKRAVDPKLIDSLYASLTNLRAAEEPLRCISHTDDYPAFTINVEGSEPIEVSTSSNCHDYVPWNVKRDGKQLVQFTGNAAAAVHALLVAVDPDRWKTRFRRQLTHGIEHVIVSDHTAGDPTKSAASVCASDLEARGRPAFGEQVKVSDLDLSCDLGSSPDCTAVTANVNVVWTGVDVRISLACTNGKMDLSAAEIAKLAAVKKLLDSKPVRVMVQLATRPPRMWGMGTWQISSGDLELPGLEWTPGSQVIEARIVGHGKPAGTKFWNALRLDATKLTRRSDGWFETRARLDFSGRLR